MWFAVSAKCKGTGVLWRSNGCAVQGDGLHIHRRLWILVRRGSRDDDESDLCAIRRPYCREFGINALRDRNGCLSWHDHVDGLSALIHVQQFLAIGRPLQMRIAFRPALENRRAIVTTAGVVGKHGGYLRCPIRDVEVTRRIHVSQRRREGRAETGTAAARVSCIARHACPTCLGCTACRWRERLNQPGLAGSKPGAVKGPASLPVGLAQLPPAHSESIRWPTDHVGHFVL